MKEDNDNRMPRESLDHALDAALAKYASAEPRVGLEERVLANLRTVEAHAAHGMWWNWRIATVLAAVLVVAGTFAWRWSRPAHPPIAEHPSAPNVKPVTAEAVNHESNSGTTQEKTVRRRVRRPVKQEIVAASPKLDVFPSPLPLSEQERILASYVAAYPEHAALVAVARMDALRHEAEVRQEIAAEGDAKQ